MALEIKVILSAVDRMSAVVQKATSKSVKNLNDFAQKANVTANKAFDVGRSSGAIGLAIAVPLGLAAKAAEDSEIATKRLNQVFKSMGDTTGKAAIEAANYANKMQFVIGVEDEEIMATQAKLATFKQVSNETARMTGIFERATNAAFDMAATGFGDAAGNAVQLGKALEDPIKGITALRKSGITFSESEQKKIKILVESGKQLEAQKIVLKAIENQVGGVAKATATMSGKSKAAFSEVAEAIGRIVLPQINNLLQKVIPVFQKIVAWIDKNPELAKTIAMVAAGIGIAAITVSVLSFAIGGVAKVMIFTKTVMATFTVTSQLMSGGLSAATVSFKALDAAMKANVIILIISLIATAVYLIINNWSTIKKFFIDLWKGVSDAFKKAWDYIINLPVMAPVKLIIDNWDKIKAFFGDLWENVKGKFMDFMDWLTGIPKRMYTAGANIVKSIWDGIKSFINKPIDAIKGMVTKIREYLPFSPAKVGPLRDIHKIRLVETIADSIKPNSLVKAMKVTTAAAMIAVNPVMGKGAGSISGASKGGASINYSPNVTINGGSPSAKEDFKKMLKDHEKDITKMLVEANRKSNRTNL
jgi:hypothetical protein